MNRRAPMARKKPRGVRYTRSGLLVLVSARQLARGSIVERILMWIPKEKVTAR
jgi:hypothetical protein